MRVGGGVGYAVTSDIPSFQELLQYLQQGSFHMSSSWLLLPSSSFTVYPSAALNPGGRTALVSTHQMTGVSTLPSTSGLAETSATDGGHIGCGTNATATQGSYIASPACDADFDESQLRRRTREILRAHPPPANNANNELCVMCVVVGPLVLCQLRSSSHIPPFRQHNKAYTLGSCAGPPSYDRPCIGGGNQQYLMVMPGNISCISCCTLAPSSFTLDWRPRQQGIRESNQTPFLLSEPGYLPPLSGTLDRPASLGARGVSLRHRYRCEDGMVVTISLLVGDHAPHSSTRRFWFQALALGSKSTGVGGWAKIFKLTIDVRHVGKCGNRLY
jgi:hypothetical protein